MRLMLGVSKAENSTIAGRYHHYISLANATTNSTESHALTDKELLFVTIERALKVYYSMFLVLLGTCFNTLSIIILSRPAFRRTSTSVYLRFLACMDMLVLYNGLSRHFVSGVSGYNIRNISEEFCKFNQWTSSFGPDTSAWILVAVTTERVISIVWPHKVRVICSKTTAAATSVIVSVIIMACNVPLLVFYGDIQVEDTENSDGDVSDYKCVPLKPEYEKFIDHVWYWIDLLKFVLLPSIILITFNVIIISFVIRSRRGMTTRNLNTTIDRRRSAAFSRNGSHAVSANSLDNKRTSGSNKEMSLTITLVVVNAIFVVCNTPVMVYLLGASYWFQSGFRPAESLTLTASVMAMYTNNAVNFLLYCATGSKFRAEISQLLPRMSKVNQSQKRDSTIYNSSGGSTSRQNESTKRTFEAHLVTITGTLEARYTRENVP